MIGCHLTVKLVLIGWIFSTFSGNLAWSAAKKTNGFDLTNLTLERKEIRSGGPPRDGIPALNDPPFVSIHEARGLRDNDRILGVSLNGIAKAYPIKILDQHEIANDRFGAKPVVVTYCPLCGSGMTFDASIGGRSVFGVSGLLYNSDVLLFDRRTESLWSQIMGKAVSGPMVGKELVSIPTTNTTWGAWKKENPDSLVLSRKTGYNRDYGRDVYGSYPTDSGLMFPVVARSAAYHAKAPVLGVKIGGAAKAYPLIELAHSDPIVKDHFHGVDLEIRYDAESQTAMAFDEKGQEVSGTLLYWFAWYAFYPETRIFQSPETPAKSRKRSRIDRPK